MKTLEHVTACAKVYPTGRSMRAGERWSWHRHPLRQVLYVGDFAREYGFTDVNGRSGRNSRLVDYWTAATECRNMRAAVRETKRRGSSRCCGRNCRIDQREPGSNSTPRKYPISL